jgi:hypothetical protein
VKPASITIARTVAAGPGSCRNEKPKHAPPTSRPTPLVSTTAATSRPFAELRMMEYVGTSRATAGRMANPSPAATKPSRAASHRTLRRSALLASRAARA